MKATATDYETVSSQTASPPSGGGLYRRIKMPLSTANLLVIIGVTALLFTIFLSPLTAGFSIQYDTNGGTAILPQTAYFDEPLNLPPNPYREGYVFSGWFTDAACTVPWNNTAPVTGSMTLYAGWQVR